MSQRSPKAPGRAAGPALEVLILARDEADVLGMTLAAVTSQLAVPGHVHVVADHCSDTTAEVARKMGAAVYVRRVGRPGKGRALDWWLRHTRVGSDPLSMIVVLDADSVVQPGFVEAIHRFARAGGTAGQAVLDQAGSVAEPTARVAAFSEFIEQGVLDRARDWLGWPVRLRGTGMAVRRASLSSLSSDLLTSVEDAELSVLLAAHGMTPRLIHGARLLDRKPASQAGAVRQRAHWIKGQLDLVVKHPREILRLLVRGPGGWSLLESVFLRPKSLMLPAKVGLALVPLLFFSGSRLGSLVAFMVGCSALIDLIAVGFAVALSGDRGRSLATVVMAPRFVLVWIKSAWLALVSREAWLRARPASQNPSLGGARTLRT
jgi:cellulose synthase/poly-beta-1,6-N-acetylglucosamine synthase-like glycosyltransferase